MALQDIYRAYEGKSPNEWQRLQSSPYTRLEYLITTHCLARFLPANGFVLDAGSGPGRYAIHLAKQGYKIAMFDLIHAMLTLGREKVTEEGISNQMVSITEGDISSLPYASSTFDAVISLGAPLSHLTSAIFRVRAVNEMIRVLKPGGYLFLTGLTRMAIYRSMVYWMNEDLIHQFKTEEIQKSGVYDGSVRWYAFQPGELHELIQDAGAKVVDEVGCEGLAAHLPAEHLERVERDPELWERWKDLLLETCNEPSIVGVSNHLLVIGRK
jgi:ubiquinone/menaquinone biosynthesis C-methylase UbiE